jgi:hypothetical protein
MTILIRDILQDLERAREYMLALSDDIRLKRDPDALRVNSEAVSGIHAEVNLSVKGLCEVIRHLLQTYNIPEFEMTVYHREGRDA